LDSLKPIRDYVMDATSLAGLNKLFANRLRLAVDEIVTNAIVHGYENRGPRAVFGSKPPSTMIN
jgi:anti-sigma regulatory factor (Ser/Thr protein kinase)